MCSILKSLSNGAILEGGIYLEEVGHLGYDFVDCTLSLAISSFSASCSPGGEEPCPTYAPASLMFCLTLGAESAEPRSMDCNL
jgi:hypothetical protein